MVRNWDAYSFTPLVWNGLNPSNGVFNLGTVGSTGTLEAWVDNAISQGQTIVFCLGGPPSWATSSGNNTDAPSNMSYWTAWVNAVTNQFKGKIKYYELWNEFNTAQFYTGTNAQMLAMAAAAYPIIHANDPAALLTTPTATESTGGTPGINTYLAQSGAASWVDITTLHNYDPNSSTYANAEDQYALTQTFQTMFASHGLSSKPLMSTEGSWFNSPTYITNTTQQANYLAKYMAFGLMLGLKSTIWYAADAGVGFGQLYPTSTTVNPAGNAFTKLQGWLVGSTITGHGIDGNGTYYLYVTLPSSQVGALVWNSSGSFSFSLPGFTSTTTLPGVTSSISGSVIATTVPQFATGPGGPPPPPPGVIFNGFGSTPYVSGSQTLIIH